MTLFGEIHVGGGRTWAKLHVPNQDPDSLAFGGRHA